jgi:hypothetical protein
MIEYRVCWSASSNITFRGATEWEPWEDEDATVKDVEDALYLGGGGAIEGLSMALEASGFEWWVETREASA